jgi:hypothetical protein
MNVTIRRWITLSAVSFALAACQERVNLGALEGTDGSTAAPDVNRASDAQGTDSGATDSGAADAGAAVDGGPTNTCAPAPATCHPRSFNQNLIDWTDQSTALLRGTVTQVNATTTGIPPVSGRQQIVVRVDAVPFERAPFLSMFIGMEITILTPTGQECAPTVCDVGYQGYFFVSGLIVGASIEDEQIARVDIGTYAHIEQDVPAIYAITQDKALYERMTSALGIVSGTVTATRSLHTPITSEHSPDWGEADVSVDCALAGSLSGTIHVRYAQSTDIAWNDSPKLTVGESAIFLLQDDNQQFPFSPPGVPGAFVVVSGLDVQQPIAAEKLATLLACPPTL